MMRKLKLDSGEFEIQYVNSLDKYKHNLNIGTQSDFRKI